MAGEDAIAPEVIRVRRQEPPSQSGPALLPPGDRVSLSTGLSSPQCIQNQSSTPNYFDSWYSREGHDYLKESLIWEKKTVLSCGMFHPKHVKWVSITMLCVGGGWPRGLYQLYILRALMDRVEFYELSMDEKNEATSSADSPLLRFHSDNTDRFQPRSRVPAVEGIYLPCHYFDYIGGTSIGG